MAGESDIAVGSRWSGALDPPDAAIQCQLARAVEYRHQKIDGRNAQQRRRRSGIGVANFIVGGAPVCRPQSRVGHLRQSIKASLLKRFDGDPVADLLIGLRERVQDEAGQARTESKNGRDLQSVGQSPAANRAVSH